MSKLKTQKTEAIFIFNRDSTNQFFLDGSYIFEIEETKSEIYVNLKAGVSTEDLRKRFRINIAFALLKAFIFDEAINVLIGS